MNVSPAIESLRNHLIGSKSNDRVVAQPEVSPTIESLRNHLVVVVVVIVVKLTIESLTL